MSSEAVLSRPAAPALGAIQSEAVAARPFDIGDRLASRRWRAGASAPTPETSHNRLAVLVAAAAVRYGPQT
jgi:hypothetical protein